MKVKDLFSVEYPSTLIYSEMLKDLAEINFVSSQGDNNGVVSKVGILPGIKIYPAGVITVPLKGTVLAAHVQPEQCYVAHQVAVLSPLKSMSLQEKLFYCTCIKHNAYRFSYGRQADRTLEELELPDFVPNWVKKIKICKPKSSVNASSFELEVKKWKPFKLSELFDISTSNDSNLQNSDLGKTPYVASSSENNGITAHIDAVPSQKANTMTIARNGSVGSVFYHSYQYCASPDDVRILSPKFALNKYNALFLKTVIEKEKYKYAYGRKLGTKRIMKMIINVPVDNDGNVDFAYMESFIRSLPNSDCI